VESGFRRLFRSALRRSGSRTRNTLRTVGEFLDHDLDHGRIQKNSIGRVASPNTVWKDESSLETLNSIDRWKQKLSQSEIVALEALIGDCLEEFGYCLSAERRDPFSSIQRST